MTVSASLARRIALGGMASAALLVVQGCAALPRSGPLASEMTTAEQPGDLEGLVAPLTAEIADSAPRPVVRRFPDVFLSAPEIDPDRIGVGDILDIMVWETGGGSIFGGAQGVTTLAAAPVESDGAVFVPFLGSVRAAGRTPADLRDGLRRALAPLTLSPQVDVRLREPRSRMLTAQGAVARPGPLALARGATRLTPVLALAGGATLPPEQVEVSVRRDGVIGAEMLDDIYQRPDLDIALRPQDVLILKPIRERFVVLGAAGAQAEITFPTRDLSLLSALGAARGLRDNDADPTGVFVLRREDRAFADALLTGPQPEGLPGGPQRPIVYRLDLTQPGALFIAQRFAMRDGDAIFATNAPLTELRKFMQLFTASLTPLQTVESLAP